MRGSVDIDWRGVDVSSDCLVVSGEPRDLSCDRRDASIGPSLKLDCDGDLMLELLGGMSLE